MSTMILTKQGSSKIASGNWRGLKFAALGDNPTYTPSPNQTSLRRERARREIERRIIADDQHTVIVTFPVDTPKFQITEVGFFDDDNVLIAIKTYPANNVIWTGDREYKIRETLIVSGFAEGRFTINAPDDEVADLYASQFAAEAQRWKHILEIDERTFGLEQRQ